MRYFAAAGPPPLQVDSGEDGMRAVLQQKGRPGECASCSITKTLQKWAQIEKKSISYCFRSRVIPQYTYGRLITIENDHKPLQLILNKPLSQAAKRLQNLMVKTDRYDIAFKFVYGKDVKLANALSRACLPESKKD